MTLETHFNEVLEVLLSSNRSHSITAEQLIHSIDLTLLDEQAPFTTLSQLNQDAAQHQVAAVCVYPQHLAEFTYPNLATVINFPEGTEDLNASLDAINKADAQEIDYVFPYTLYLDGQQDEALNRCHAVIQACKTLNLTVKIILETGAFPDNQNIYEISMRLIKSGADFLKTSTGKIPQGASLATVFAMLSAIKDSGVPCGLKVSGGVKTAAQAHNYALLAQLMLAKPINKTWFRIGASGLLGELLKIKCTAPKI